MLALPAVRRWLLVLLLLPSALILVYRVVPPPITPLMVWRLIQGEGLTKAWRPLSSISPELPQAVIASEDNRFCEHAGFDWAELEHQFDRAWAGESIRGASTITMQVAKNVLLWPGRDPVRKLFEAMLTPQIELFWNKRRIIEIYLNVAETGPGLYGAEAASRKCPDAARGGADRRRPSQPAPVVAATTQPLHPAAGTHDRASHRATRPVARLRPLSARRVSPGRSSVRDSRPPMPSRRPARRRSI